MIPNEPLKSSPAVSFFKPLVRIVFSLCLLLPWLACATVVAQAVATPPQESQSATEKAPVEKVGQTDEKVGQTDGSLAAEEKGTKHKPGDHFMRIRKDRKGRSVSLDTSITRYELTNENGKKVYVDLIGAVHIGEKEYYDQLNKEFENYDSLLYELVAPEGTVIPKGGRPKEAGGIPNPVAAMQQGMQAVTELEFQLQHIDYTKENFVHADMSPEEFAESMKENGESVGGYVLKAMTQSMAMQNKKKDPTLSFAMAMFSKNRALRIRRAMADQIRDMESGMAIFEGKDGSTIIDHRNAKCMEVLKREMAAGETKIGIFYGAGHLMDMERRLLSDFKAKRGGQHWLTAWKLTKRIPEK